MSDWAIVAIVALGVIYKLAERWIDSNGEGHRETDTYSATETMPHEIRDDGERFIPDVQLGFQREAS